MTPKRPGCLLIVMCAGMFLILLDVTVVNVAIPSIEAGLRAGTVMREGDPRARHEWLERKA